LNDSIEGLEVKIMIALFIFYLINDRNAKCNETVNSNGYVAAYEPSASSWTCPLRRS
jgi:hypothetical protein